MVSSCLVTIIPVIKNGMEVSYEKPIQIPIKYSLIAMSVAWKSGIIALFHGLMAYKGAIKRS